MHHYFNSITNAKGDALTGYYVKVVDPDTSDVVDIYADSSATPIVSVSGLANAAQVDSDGNVSFYVDVGTYDLDIYATDGTTLIRRIENIPMNIDEDTAELAVAAQEAAEEAAEEAANSAGAAATSEANAAASALAAAAVFEGTAGIVALPRLTPEMYGAIGLPLGVDDGAALEATAGALSAIGRGVVEFYPGRTYPVGAQTAGGTGPFGVVRYAPDTPYIFEIDSCTGPVVVNGNGARIQCVAGKRYGTFNADDSDYVGQGALADTATPYHYMIYVHDCTGSVTIRNLELDGNIETHNIGGGYDTTGIQFPMDGIMLADNTGPILIENVYSHHHGRDGIIVDGPGDLVIRENGRIVNSRFLNNGRQGCSMVGGNGWSFINSNFSDTGQDIGSMTYSAPGAGFDAEAEGGKKVMNVTFDGCEFSNCKGASFVAPNETVANCSDFTFRDCSFIGTESWSCWGRIPRGVWEGCLFVGAAIYFHWDANVPANAAKFILCRFIANEDLTPNGVMYPPLPNAAKFINWTGSSTNILFDRCLFEYAPTGTPELTQFQPTAGLCHDCSFVGPGSGFSFYGPTSGINTKYYDTDSHPDAALAAARFKNHNSYPAYDAYQWAHPTDGHALATFPATADRSTGKRLYYGTATYNPPSLAAGAKDTIQTMTVTGVALGDQVEDISFSVDLAGARIHAWVSAANTVSYYAINENGANPLDLASGTLRVTVRQA